MNFNHEEFIQKIRNEIECDERRIHSLQQRIADHGKKLEEAPDEATRQQLQKAFERRNQVCYSSSTLEDQIDFLRVQIAKNREFIAENCASLKKLGLCKCTDTENADDGGGGKKMDLAEKESSDSTEEGDHMSPNCFDLLWFLVPSSLSEWFDYAASSEKNKIK